MKKSNLILTAAAIVATVILLAFSSGPGGPGIFSSANGCIDIQDKEVKIGNQVWMTENLNVDRFLNGDLIPEAKSTEDWVLAGKNRRPACCIFQNDSAFGAANGRIYNWYAITDPRGLAPSGWKIPDNEDWMELSEFLGGEREAGKKMKSATGWNNNGSGNNESGFNAAPSGGRYANGTFVFRGESIGIWSGTAFSQDSAWFRYLTYSDDLNHKYALKKAGGMYVRCIRQ